MKNRELVEALGDVGKYFGLVLFFAMLITEEEVLQNEQTQP